VSKRGVWIMPFSFCSFPDSCLQRSHLFFEYEVELDSQLGKVPSTTLIDSLYSAMSVHPFHSCKRLKSIECCVIILASPTYLQTQKRKIVARLLLYMF
jgi:hypothetical protein